MSDFYVFVKEHLSKNEVERFAGLHHISTDAGRGENVDNGVSLL